MQALKLHIFLFIAAFMLVSKPFMGFSVYKQLQSENSPTILVKAFAKRKHEYIENGQFDIQGSLKHLADPLQELTLLLGCLLASLFPAVLNTVKNITNGFLANIRLSLLPSQQLYLLAGKLSI
ncbi:hypothetical protein [Mucilaginibacter paludis]|uniref:Uncharacterized protein n=1 Tax=Mucilaginibacter paludis DSM 18603 TaxID=714943 RepID=H1YBF9_9SPHI|nr:hypothetical protein [Mucilaginibacter paludis]EHQ25030.1 hypothetical protein Mucpa_0849 [Mucilaginibacter paludis DSM 18603]